MSKGDLEVRGLLIPAAEIVELASRASGPGGQNVNKVSTRVTLRWDVRESDALSESQRTRLVERLDNRLTQRGILVVNASRMRSRVRNRELARQRLAELVDEALAVPRSRTPTRATRASKVRHQTAKQQRAQLKRRRARVSVDDE